MKMVVAILALLFSASGVVAQSSSAAEIYRAAAKAVPARVDAAEAGVWRDVLDAPVNDAAQHIIERGAKSLELFDAASQLAFGDWGFDPDDSMYAAHDLNGAGELTNLVVLRARLRASRKQYALALDDCFNLAQLARRLSVQPSLVRQQQQNAMFAKALETAASMLPDAPPELVRKFVLRFTELHSPADPVEIAKVSQRTYMWLYQRLIDNPRWRLLSADMGTTLNDTFGIPGEMADVADLAKDAELCDSVFAQTKQAFDDMIAALDAAPVERDAAMVIIPNRFKGAHALVRGACDLIRQTHRLDRSQGAIEDMFEVAAQISATKPIGDEAAQTLAGKYHYSASAHGFDLTANLFGEPQPLVLHVGPRAVREQPATQRSSSGR